MSNETQESKMMALEQYKILYQAYADEIKNLWQRSLFLGAFMTLAWGGYGALQLKFIEKIFDKTFSINAYHYFSFTLCGVIIILSLLWIAMAKGSKFVQEAHEEHIKRYTKLYHCSIYCDLDKYEKKLNKNLCGDLFFCGTLKAYRYSPSKINIALGWVSCLVAFSLSIMHNILAFGWLIGIIVALVYFIVICFITSSIKDCLKGRQNKIFLKEL